MGSWSLRGKAANLAVTGLALTLLGASPTGGVFVTTLPAGADVWIDGSYLGRSPLVLDAVSAGAHRLTLTRTGWSSQDLSVTVTPAVTVTTSVILVHEGKVADAGGTLAIHADHVGGIAVDGEPVVLAKDGTIAMSAGAHEVSATGPQGKISRTVTVYPQTRTDVMLTGDAPAHSVVIAPADDYLPASAVLMSGGEITVHYNRHDVVAHVGSAVYLVDRRSMTFDTAPTVIKKRVYLPIELLTLLTANAKT